MELTSTTPRRPAWLNALLALAVLSSAWLLFQVQPMVAKRILPWYGGGTAVWTTAMLFFQSVLFLGYLYAHLSVRLLSAHWQVAVHAALLAAAAGLAIAVGVLPGPAWIPDGNRFPAGQILLMLAACVGLPYLMLSATAPLAQTWFARANPGVPPYRLYALSNFGSMAALISYPFAVEPNLGVLRQGAAWSAMFVGFAAICAASGIVSLRRGAAEGAVERPEDGPSGGERPPWIERTFWLALPACASAVLLATTNHLCLDVASVPFLWIAPMVVYLATFILAFESDRWYRRQFWHVAAAAASFAACYQWHRPEVLTFGWELGVQLALLFCIGMVCHGELARMRPAPQRLTAYYLCIAAGGAIGGMLVGLAAPALLKDFHELPIAVAAAWLLAIAVFLTQRDSALYDGRSFWKLVAILATFAVLVASMLNLAAKKRSFSVVRARNFYGVLRVKELASERPDYAHYTLTNGRISHGSQFLAPEHRRVPTQYFQTATGIGQILLLEDGPRPRRVGVVGLGAGTLAAYAEAGDEFVFYEINPKVIEFADKYFTYLEDARKRGATIDVVEGDGRLSLERESREFDVLALDAFTSDAVPAHLLTVEAFGLYLRRLKNPAGVLAVHVSNDYLDMPLVVAASTAHHGLACILVESPPDNTPMQAIASWLLAHRQKEFFAQHEFGYAIADPTQGARPVTWTDDFSNLLKIVRRN